MNEYDQKKAESSRPIAAGERLRSFIMKGAATDNVPRCA